jgi:hypothetical protein
MTNTTVSAAGGAMSAARLTYPGLIGDRMIYLVICSHKGAAYLHERDLADMDRVTTVQHVAEGQFETLVQVIELNPVEHTSRDVTEDIVSDVANIWAQGGEALTDWQRDFIEQHQGVIAANRYRRAA